MTAAAQIVFPFKLEDLKSWVVKRSDGTVTKFTLVNEKAPTSAGTTTSSAKTGSGETTSMTMYGRTTHNFADYCNHKPGDVPVAEFTDDNGVTRRLYVGSMAGARATRNDHDFVIDCGDIFNSWQCRQDTLEGDAPLVDALAKYVAVPIAARILKIDWDDRQAPDVIPEFWTRLNEQLHGDIMTCCVGGHGRSGTSFVCLLLNNAPDYDALDAIVHLRAVHCPRAIESVSQHEYINDVARYLGRVDNAKLAHDIKDYKAAFLASNQPTAIATRKYLGWGEFAGNK